MKRLLSLVLIALVSLVSVTGLMVQGAIAAPMQQVIGPDDQSYGSREEAYDQAMKTANDPKGLEKEFEKDVEIFKEENPDEKDLVSGADKLVDEAKDIAKKVTGNMRK
jgi:ABC-type Na+ efflux pump permease subunit